MRKKQTAPMRVLAAACRFLGRLLFLFIFSSRLEQGRDSGSLGPPHCTDQGSVQRGLSPARAQPSTGSHQRGLNMQQKHHLRQQHPLQVHRWAFLLALCLAVQFAVAVVALVQAVQFAVACLAS